MNGLVGICHKAPALQSYIWQSHRSTYMHRVAFSGFLEFLMYSRTKNKALQQRGRIPCRHFLFNYGRLCLNCLVGFLWHHLLLCLTHSNFRSPGQNIASFTTGRDVFYCLHIHYCSYPFVVFAARNSSRMNHRSNLMLQMDCITLIQIIHECL